MKIVVIEFLPGPILRPSAIKIGMKMFHTDHASQEWLLSIITSIGLGAISRVDYEIYEIVREDLWSQTRNVIFCYKTLLYTNNYFCIILEAKFTCRPADRMAYKFVWLLSANHRCVLWPVDQWECLWTAPSTKFS